MMAVATASMAHRVQPSASIPRCIPLVPRPRSIQPHRLTRGRACAARPSELLIHHVQGAEDAVFVTEKLSVVGRRSSFDRGAGVLPRRSRAAPRELPRAAAALLPAGDLALGAMPAGQGDAGASFVSVAHLHYGMGVAHGPPTGGLKTAMLGVCVRT